MSIIIERIPNMPKDSNCYVVYDKNFDSCIIIDPGTEDCKSLIDFVKSKKKCLSIFFLLMNTLTTYGELIY